MSSLAGLPSETLPCPSTMNGQDAVYTNTVYMHTNSLKVYYSPVETAVTPSSQRRMKHREVEHLVQGHIAKF